MANPRLICIEALRKTRQDKGYSNLVINSVLDSSELDNRDKAFVCALYYGVLERVITLDYIISEFCSMPLKKISPFVLNCLRTGIYQIKYMDRIPDSAAVNETVKLVKKRCASASGMVNAVLRRACREGILLPEGDSAEDMSIRYSCKKWIVNELINDYGADTAREFLECSLETPPVYVRVNTLKTTADKLKESFLQQGTECEEIQMGEALKLKNIGSVEDNPLYKQGLFHVEDLAAQWAVKALDTQKGHRVLDMCAAPGGKTFSAAEYMENTGEVLAFDIYESRVGLIKSGAARLGLNNITAITADSTVYDQTLGEFDRVLCDVPCSGIGIIRRKPDIKYKEVEDFSQLQDIQFKLLCTAAKYLKKGGRLVYSTCTLRRNENADLVQKFLEENKEFSPKITEICGERSWHKTFLPQRDGTDGFFIAVLTKE